MRKTFLFITLLLGFHTAWGHDAEVDGIFYNLNKGLKKAYVTKSGRGYYSGEIVIPENVTVKGTVYTVTVLEKDCFYNCSGLTSITIPNSVTSLEDYCFYGCSGLTSITIPNSVTSLGDN